MCIKRKKISCSFHHAHYRCLSCCVMPADSFAANFLKGRLEPTILYMGHRGPELGGGVVFTVTGMATNGLHHNQDPPCLRLQGRAAGSTVDKRRWRETWVCIAGIQSWGRGRNGNAESVKPHESPGEGGNGYTAVGKGKREVTDWVRCAEWCFVIPFITYLWMLNWQLSPWSPMLIWLVVEGGAPPRVFKAPICPSVVLSVAAKMR